jgi:hypothetical protein
MEPEQELKVRYPNITVELTGQDGNAFFILGTVKRALRKGNVPQAEIDQFFHEATQGDYDDLLQTCMKWVNVE